MSSLAVTGLVKGFGTKTVLRGVDLSVAPAGITALLGPSGSGKTTLLRLVCGFERPSAGVISIDGEVVDDTTRFVPPERRGIGYVPQEGNLFPHLTVAGNVRFGLPRGAASRERVRTLLEMIGLADRARSFPHQLSGGQQQRVALARALAVEPRLVLLDEPFASLDASLRASVRADVIGILRAAGATALLVTHDQDEALSLSDSVAVLRDGIIAQVDSPQSIYSHPVDADLAHFLGEVNLLEGVAAGGRVATSLGDLPLTGPDVDGPVTVMVRPEQLMLDDGGGIGCRVVSQEYYGHDAIVRLSLGDGEHPLPGLVVRVRGGSAWRPGTTASVRVEGPVVAYSRSASSVQP